MSGVRHCLASILRRSYGRFWVLAKTKSILPASRRRFDAEGLAVKYKVLILGASYGSLFSTKLLMAGHRVSLVCTKPTAELINREGTRVRFPIRGRQSPLEIGSKDLPGALSASIPGEISPADFDLVVLGMQEAQYGSTGVRELMGRIAEAQVPCLAIMNMPPLPYLKRIPGLSTESLDACYADPAVWKDFDPE